MVLDLGWLTVGTADVADTVVHTWVAKLLISPPWGVVRHAGAAAAGAISDIAELHRTLVPGDTPPIAAWDSAARAARTIAQASEGAERYAVRTAYQSTALIETDDWGTLDAVTGNALKSHRLANGDDGPARILDVTRNAIRSWRRLARSSVVDNDVVPAAVGREVSAAQAAPVSSGGARRAAAAAPARPPSPWPAPPSRQGSSRRNWGTRPRPTAAAGRTRCRPPCRTVR